MNPAQFAPHEDLATYPRTLPHDLQVLLALSVEVPSKEGTGTQKRTPDAVFVPSVKEMYPSGISQTVSEQKGTFVEVKGFGHQMEGSMRPDFFRGVATVVTKLFHVIEVRNGMYCWPSHDSWRYPSRQRLTLGRRIYNRHSFFESSQEISCFLTHHPRIYILCQPLGEDLRFLGLLPYLTNTPQLGIRLHRWHCLHETPIYNPLN